MTLALKKFRLFSKYTPTGLRYATTENRMLQRMLPNDQDVTPKEVF
jgi:hypothetical protein